MIVVKAYKHNNVEISLDVTLEDAIGQGTFGKVFKASIKQSANVPNNQTNNEWETVAIKQISLKLSNCERELKILNTLDHPNILIYKYHFYSLDNNEKYLNIIFDFISNNLYTVYMNYMNLKRYVPILFTKIITYQLLRGLAYLHHKGICHRDIKPLNLLVQSPKHVLKIGDFGSAKQLVTGETNISYICSRYYRAPELVFGSISYTAAIDIWSAGCVLAELMIGRPFFIAPNSVDLVCEMSKILGTPTKQDILEINEAFDSFTFPKIQKSDFSKIFPHADNAQLISLLEQMLVFAPSKRIDPKTALLSECFQTLVQQAATFTFNGNPNVLNLVDFSAEELSYAQDLQKLKILHDDKMNQLRSSSVEFTL